MLTHLSKLFFYDRSCFYNICRRLPLEISIIDINSLITYVGDYN